MSLILESNFCLTFRVSFALSCIVFLATTHETHHLRMIHLVLIIDVTHQRLFHFKKEQQFEATLSRGVPLLKARESSQATNMAGTGRWHKGSLTFSFILSLSSSGSVSYLCCEPILYFLYYYIVIRLCIHKESSKLSHPCVLAIWGTTMNKDNFKPLQIHSLENLMDSTWFKSLLQSSAVTNDGQF